MAPVAVVGLRLYTLLTRHPRVRVVLINEKHEALLVKNVISTHDRWVLPGGGVNFRESVQAAASREIHEETGMTIAQGDLRLVRTVPRSESKLPYVAVILSAACHRSDLPNTLHNPYEIAVAQWFPVQELPVSASDFTIRAVQEAATA